jgi:hypothetical protein
LDPVVEIQQGFFWLTFWTTDSILVTIKQVGATMLANKELTTAEATAIIEQLETIADRLFAAGSNTLGNNIQEVIYCMEARLEEQIG